MTTILAIDSSTEACSCALSVDGQVNEKFEVVPRQHARLMLPMIDELMSQHSLTYPDLDAIAVGRGPGSFTGLRIATGIAQGIAFGSNRPVVPVSTLASLALQAYQESGESRILSCLDARINEVYWAVYEIREELPVCFGKENLCKPENIITIDDSPEETLFGAGNGMAFLDSMQENIRNKVAGYNINMYPRASAMAQLASHYFKQDKTVSPEKLSPVYIRNKVTG